MNELHRRYQLNTIEFLVDNAAISDQFSLKTAIDFRIRHGNRNAIERIFREIERRTSSFANSFSNVALETVQEWLEALASTTIHAKINATFASAVNATTVSVSSRDGGLVVTNDGGLLSADELEGALSNPSHSEKLRVLMPVTNVSITNRADNVSVRLSDTRADPPTELPVATANRHQKRLRAVPRPV